MKLADGSFLINPEDKPWLPLGEPGNFMKILHIDEADRQVVFLQRFAKNTTHPKHTHHCTAVAFTLRGEWAYDGTPFPLGAVAFEPYGSTHTPMTLDDNDADVLVILTSRDERFITAHISETEDVELDMAMFKSLAAMTPEEAAALQKQNAGPPEAA